MVRIYLLLLLFLYLGSKFNLFASPLVYTGDTITNSQVGLTLVFVRQVDRSEIGRIYNVGDMITIQSFPNANYFIDTAGIWHNANRLNYNFVFYDPLVNGVIDASIQLKRGDYIKVINQKVFEDGTIWNTDDILICTAMHPTLGHPKFKHEGTDAYQWSDWDQPNYGRGIWWEILTTQPNFNNPTSNYFTHRERGEFTFGDYVQIPDAYFRDTSYDPSDIKLGFWGNGNVHTEFESEDRYSPTNNTNEIGISVQIAKQGDNLPESFKLNNYTWTIETIHPIVITQGQYRRNNDSQYPFRYEKHLLSTFNLYNQAGSIVLGNSANPDGSLDFANMSATKYIEVSFKFSYKVTHDIGNSYIKEFVIEVPIDINFNAI